jgi:1-acyl-sn-glycerol-3-phosphate acyltransferase
LAGLVGAWTVRQRPCGEMRILEQGERPRPWRRAYRRDRDLPWARSPAARAVRGALLNFVIGPVVHHYGHPRVRGLENLRGLRPPFLLAANHSSHLDTPAILLALPPRLRRRTLVAAAADYFFDEPWKGALVALAVGAIAVERERPPRQSVKLVRRLLQEGWNLVVFPEGGRSHDGRLHRGKRGIAHLAAAAGVPVVPVGIVGTFAALPAGYHWPRRSQLEVRFGKPMFRNAQERPQPGPAGLRSATEGIMASIQALTGQELAAEEAVPLDAGGARRAS